jgi:hypothetical protein
MECFWTTDFDNKSRLITLPAIIISGLHCICIEGFVYTTVLSLVHFNKYSCIDGAFCLCLLFYIYISNKAISSTICSNLLLLKYPSVLQFYSNAVLALTLHAIWAVTADPIHY